MNNDLNIFSSSDLKDTVQDMRELLSQSRLAFLLGAGCSKIAGLPLMPELTSTVLEHKEIGANTKKLLEKVQESFSGAASAMPELTSIVLADEEIGDDTKKPLKNVQESLSGAASATIEDYMSEIVDLLSIAERRTRCGAKEPKVSVRDQETDATELQTALDEIKKVVSSAIGNIEVNIATHQQFVRAIHGALQAGKEGRGVDYFILNYDTLIEDALGLERVVYCDGFTGAATGWWKPSTFTSDGKAVRVFKIHGSIDWCLLKDDSLPRRIRSGIKTESDTNHVLIYPAATKYQETQRDPFAKMLDYMRKSLCPDEGKEMVLAICGYNFGDSHIDLEIENALHQSEGRLTIAAFVGTDKPSGKLRRWLDDAAINQQIRVYAKKGFFHGNKESKSGIDLPWWKFEILARLLGGER